MFGYIRPDQKNLLVKELELYKAVYCGLCNALHKYVSPFMPLTLNYDFVLLASLRLALERTPPRTERKRCTASPFKKKCRLCVSECAPLIYTAQASTVLSYYQLKDDILDRDKPFFKRALKKIILILITPAFKKICRENSHIRGLSQKTRDNLSKLSALEKTGSSDIDTLADISGQLLADAASTGLEGENYETASQLGKNIGKWLYIIDAFDDMEKDSKSGAFNPLTVRFGSVEKVKQNAEAIDAVISNYVYAASQLTDNLPSTCYNGIIKNIITEGLDITAQKVLFKTNGKVKKTND